jgi:hypothetical protein
MQRRLIHMLCFLAGVTLATSSSAQITSTGNRDANGRVLAKIVVTMSEPGAYGRPANALSFLVVADDGDRISMRTNDAGVASAWLPSGNYRLVTPDPLEWEGNAYTWDRMIEVRTGMRVIQLTQDDARSIAVAASTQSSRTSEPVSLSSQPTPWKSTRPPTEDLRASVAKPARQQPVANTARQTPVVTTVSRVEPRAVEPTSEQRVSSAPQPARHVREGFWFNLGTGYGAATCKTCSETVNGYSGGLSLGATISPRLRLGVGTTSWYKYEDGASLVAGTLDARIRFYPSTTGGFFLTGGIGAGTIGAALADYGSATEFGGGAMLGLGWDVGISENVSLTPFWNAFAVTTSNADVTVGQIGLGFTFH